MFGGKQVKDDPETSLARCIVLLDDIRAYRRKDVEQIEIQFTALRKSRFSEFYDMWVKTRPYAEKIVDMPAMIPGVKKLIRAISWLKLLNKVFMILVVLFISLQIVPIWRSSLGADFLSGTGLYLLIGTVLVVVATLNVVSLLDYRTRKKIIAYEDETMDKYAPAREKMKEGVSRMMKSLARESKRSGKDTNYYALVLYFDDYENIEVVDKWRPRSMGLFKKSYNHYHVVPKA
jgi:hypothetical protein